MPRVVRIREILQASHKFPCLRLQSVVTSLAMGEIINSSAHVDRIAEHVVQAYQKGVARGGDIADACKSRLETSVSAVELAKTANDAAHKAENASWGIVLAMDTNADITIGSTRDEMWNALGRPRQSPQMDEVFAGGVRIYTSGDPRNQPVLMHLLHARILAASAPQWPEQKRIAWAASIEAVRAPYESAVNDHRPIEAAAMVTEAAYRAAVRTAHARLKSLKRDLKSLGLTESQIHEIIPDASSGSSPTPSKE